MKKPKLRVLDLVVFRGHVGRISSLANPANPEVQWSDSLDHSRVPKEDLVKYTEEQRLHFISAQKELVGRLQAQIKFLQDAPE